MSRKRNDRGEEKALRQTEIRILRRKNRDAEPYWQSFFYTPEERGETVASALTRLNEREPLTDTKGDPVSCIRWECSCLQKKCGACAMVINGRPMLACDAFLEELGRTIELKPLSKFPPVCDLTVDRSVLFRNLSEMNTWLKSEAVLSEKVTPYAHEASRCLQCGCCLEVCPGFMPEGRFFGMSSMVPYARIISEMPAEKKRDLKEKYRKHIYDGCGKSLACRNICPAGINIEELMVRSNRDAVRLLDLLRLKGS